MKTEIEQRGMETSSHWGQVGGGFIFCRAMIFCGEEIGDAIPPMLEAKAIPRMRHRAYCELCGKVRRMGYGSRWNKKGGSEKKETRPFSRPLFLPTSKLTWIKLKQSTGAATLLIHILAKQAVPILTRSTHLGWVPARFKRTPANFLAMWCFERAAASVKPPIKSMITGENMVEKMYLAASCGESRV